MRNGTILLGLVSAPFLLESGFEMYVLTLINGRQNLFFSISHLGPIGVLALAASGIAGVVFGMLVCVRAAAGAMRAMRGEERWAVGWTLAAGALTAHFALLATYSVWAR